MQGDDTTKPNRKGFMSFKGQKFMLLFYLPQILFQRTQNVSCVSKISPFIPSTRLVVVLIEMSWFF